jgi:hypothetical protein
VGVEVVVEYPEESVEPNVDAGRLQQLRLEGRQREVARLDLGDQVTVGEQHRNTIPTCPFGVFWWACRTLVR